MTPLNAFDSLEDAKAYSAPKEILITPDMVIAFLTEHNSVTSLQESTDEKARGFLMAISSGGIEFNLMDSHAVGQKQQAILTYLVSIDAVTQGFADACMSYANQTWQPYADTTEYQFMKAKGTCPVKEVFPSNGWLKIEVTEECEAHAPQIYATIQGVKTRVAGFSTIGLAGPYLARVPSQYGVLEVDDAYGVIQ
ncbi:hypothetical protein [Alteromonas sp. RKMC-009]|uniref:hypothetical protein n=1 Tax=Alteromonas sp. RKMC-009 TaxID=2267264 RepID=UPI000E677612|nr:hypothetical protein [Alteromonas sp. RKMC-009]AYA64315.1 hypothetical protein DS731_10070 [Alteromonas sp. RKMC-009]